MLHVPYFLLLLRLSISRKEDDIYVISGPEPRAPLFLLFSGSIVIHLLQTAGGRKEGCVVWGWVDWSGVSGCLGWTEEGREGGREGGRGGRGLSQGCQVGYAIATLSANGSVWVLVGYIPYIYISLTVCSTE